MPKPTIAPIIVNEGHVYNRANPHTHLTLLGDPAGSRGARCMTGTLRPAHQGHANSAAAFVRAKLAPASSATSIDWTVTAHRAEVLLPHTADDRLVYPQALFEAIDAEHPAGGKALLTYITLTWIPRRLHHQWELGRKLARQLVHENNVPVLVIQHTPGKVASTNNPHLHLIVGPRRIEAWGGFGGYVAPLLGDRLWAPMRARFQALLAETGEPVS